MVGSGNVWGGLLGGLIKHPTLYSPLLPRGTLRVPPPWENLAREVWLVW